MAVTFASRARSLRWAAALAAVIAVPLGGCRSAVPKEPALDAAELGLLEDVLNGPLEPAFAFAPGSQLALGRADRLPELLDWRRTHAQAGTLLIDLSPLDPDVRQPVIDDLLLAALEPGGPILIDREGHWSARLLGPAAPPAWVSFGPDGRIQAREPLSP